MQLRSFDEAGGRAPLLDHGLGAHQLKLKYRVGPSGFVRQTKKARVIRLVLKLAPPKKFSRLSLSG